MEDKNIFYCLTFEDIQEIIEDFTQNEYDIRLIQKLFNQRGNKMTIEIGEKARDVIIEFWEKMG